MSDDGNQTRLPISAAERPRRARQIVVLVDDDDWSLSEVEHELGVSRDEVATFLHAGRLERERARRQGPA